ncbi:MAG TPA: hypothetical protein GXZ20_06130, partial [Halanaerobiaceae bacterium]|nr:hypothetical protein [Halanaerobiaceae bacterium]
MKQKRKNLCRLLFILIALVMLISGCEENKQYEVQGEEPRNQVEKEDKQEAIADLMPISALFPFHQ